MAGKRFSAEQIIIKLREAEVGLAQGQRVGQVSKQMGVSEQTYYRWRKEYGGLRLDQAKRLKVLEKENTRLKKLVADLSLDKQILKGSVLGKLLGPANRRRAVMWVRERLGTERVSERRACQVLGQIRSTQRRERQIPDDEARLVTRMVRVGYAIRALWLPAGHGDTSWGRVEGEILSGWRGCGDKKG